jgi:hypothetical protein
MTLIETKTLGTAAASIEFTSIPQDGTDLVAVCSLRASDTGPWASIQLNGSTANFSRRALEGYGSSVASNSRTDGLNTQVQNPSNYTSNTFSSGTIYIPNYTGSTAKSFSVDTVAENNATDTVTVISAHLWNNTAAITSLAIVAQVGQLVAGSTISLYKITKGTDGIVVVS